MSEARSLFIVCRAASWHDDAMVLLMHIQVAEDVAATIAYLLCFVHPQCSYTEQT